MCRKAEADPEAIPAWAEEGRRRARNARMPPQECGVSPRIAPYRRWTTPSTAPDPDDQYRRVRVTHRFHPLSGRDFEFVVHRRNWGEDRVYCRDEDGELFSLPAAWTDVAPADPFVVIAAGRCPFTAGGLLAVADLVDRLRSHPGSGTAVRQIMPRMLRRL